MNLELFIARRLLRGTKKNTISVPIVKIALVGIALGVCVMLLSIFVIAGFKQEITHKLTGFSSHLNIVSYGNTNYYGESKVRFSDTLYSELHAINGVKNAYGFITKPGILKSDTEIHGGVLYGVDSLYDRKFIEENVVDGVFPDYMTGETSNDILLSTSVANLLGVKTGDKIQAHFVQEPPRVRVFTVKGLYNTGFKEYDDLFAFCDMRHLQRLNGWTAGEMSGIAVELDEMELIPDILEDVEAILPWGESGNDFYKVQTIYEMSPQIFDWLELLNVNVWVIMILLIAVAGFNMVSGLFILILDKTSLIGILKAFGYRNVSLRKLFLYISMGLIGRGIIWGNLLAFLLAFLQYKFNIIRLDPSAYYMDTVPLVFNVGYILLLDVSVLFIATLMLVIPTMLISRIKPIKAIRFE
ncbi:ABC transporter permease [Odoribacter sp. OttesenSCG-928-G04]|nr:ABC transporter permease [Odoribacter sp. OttesenSCG-928-G04]MDL2330477.1 ABC transporter permease [Odoribacter sp. OttesenSCG-928-A06]